MTDLMYDDFGVAIDFALTRGGVNYDLSGHTITLTFTKPSGATITKSGTYSGNVASYTIEEGLLDERGWWTINVGVARSGLRIHGETRQRVR